jgi:hypothetical protein
MKVNYEKNTKLNIKPGDLIMTTDNEFLLVVIDQHSGEYVIIDITSNVIVDTWETLNWVRTGCEIEGYKKSYYPVEVIDYNRAELIIS